MQVEYAFLADAAQVDRDGKLHALGAGIDRIRSHAFPASHPYLALVVKLQLHPAECDRRHHLEVELWDPDGRRLGALGADFAAQRQADAPMRPVFAQLVFNFVNQQFPVHGDYAFHILVDGQHLKEMPLYLEELATPGPGKQG